VIKIRLENYDVNGEFCYTRVWAGDEESRHLTNCGILAFFHEEWFAFMSLFRGQNSPIPLEITHLDETRRQLQFDFESEPILPDVVKRRERSA
jgi:hypothetical protein